MGGLQRQRIMTNRHSSVQSKSLPSLVTACRRFHSHRQRQHQLRGKRTTSKELPCSAHRTIPTKKTVHADIPVQALKKLLKLERHSPLQLGCYQYGFFVIGSKQERAKVEAQAVHHEDSVAKADDGQRWAAVKAFTLCGVTRVPKNAVLTTLEVNTGPQAASAHWIAKTLDACNIFTKVRVHFEVANIPHKTSIARMRAQQKPRWKWELA